MRLINPNDMVRALRGGVLPVWEIATYTVLYVVGCIAVILLPQQYSSPVLHAVDKGLFVTLLFVEIIAAHHINKQGDGRQFWQRYFSLCASQIVCMTVAGFLLGILLPFIFGTIEPSIVTDGVTGIPEVAALHMVGVSFLAWLLVLMRRVSMKQA